MLGLFFFAFYCKEHALQGTCRYIGGRRNHLRVAGLFLAGCVRVCMCVCVFKSSPKHGLFLLPFHKQPHKGVARKGTYQCCYKPRASIRLRNGLSRRKGSCTPNGNPLACACGSNFGDLFWTCVFPFSSHFGTNFLKMPDPFRKPIPRGGSIHHFEKPKHPPACCKGYQKACSVAG